MDSSYDIGNSDGAPNKPNISLEYTKKDIKELRQMWEDIFNDPDEFIDYYFEDVCRENKILVAYDGSVPVGMLHLNPYKVTEYNKIVDCIYIVGVAVKRKYRRKGIMKSMIQKVIDDNRNLSPGFLFLMPEEKEYYMGLGFKTIYETLILECNIMYEYQVEERIYKDFETSGLGISNLSDYDEAGLLKLASIIDAHLSKDYSVYSVRDVQYLSKMLTEHMCQNGDVCIIKIGSSDVVGLFSYEIYDGILYAERVEVLAGNVNDIFTCIVKLTLENACVGCVATFAADRMADAQIDIQGLDIQVSEGHGIMAYITNDNISIDDLKNKTFFDEIV